MAKKVKVDWKIVIAGIVCMTVLESIALMKGIDGIMLSAIFGIIGLAIGVVIPNPLKT